MDLIFKIIKTKAKEIKLIVQIEHVDAINNLNEIIDLDGVEELS